MTRIFPALRVSATLSLFGAFLINHNKLMHLINGNIRITFLNSDGLMGKDRKSALGALNSDILALSETHLTPALMKVLHGRFPGYQSFWGTPVTGKNGGVGFLVKPNAAWHISPIEWPETSSCFPHYKAGRLHAIKVFLDQGSAQFVVYTLYGVSGARWSTDLKLQTHKLVEDVCIDIAARGLPCLFGGDLNLQLQDSPLLERLPQLNFANLAIVSNKAHEATCFSGKNNSTIDHVFANSLMMATFESFQIGARTGLADHAPLICLFKDKCESQRVLRNRFYGDTPTGTPLNFQPSTDFVLPQKFFSSLRSQDVDSAFRCWSYFAENHLQTIWNAIDKNSHFSKGRGTIRLDPQHVWPHIRGEAAAPLRVRRMWKHCCRMVQLQKSPHGQQAKNTWKNAQKVLSLLNADEFQTASPLLAATCSQENAQKLLKCFNTALVRIQKEEQVQRISNWKAKLQNNLSAQHSWLKQDTVQQQNSCFQNTEGQYTANLQEQFQAVRQAWSAVTNLFKTQEPDHDSFFQDNQQFIPQCPYQSKIIDRPTFCSAILSTPESSPGLDQWTFKDLKLLATLEEF